MTNGALDQAGAAMLERVVVGGDLSKLSSTERLLYYRQVCDSIGLNPLTRPFQYITLNGRLTLYAGRDATDQLRKIHEVSITDLHTQRMDDLYVVVAKATDGKGRVDAATGAVSLAGLKGEAAANAMMKAETKAKRRVTLSLCGLGLLDESEVDSVSDANRVAVDTETGEILSVQPAKSHPDTEASGPSGVGASGGSQAPSAAPQNEAAEKDLVLGRIRAGWDMLKLGADARVELWQKYCGIGTFDTTAPDVAQLGDLLADLQKQYKSKK